MKSGDFMDTVVVIVKSLVVLAFLTLLLEMILPQGSTKKYAKFVMGLLVVLVIINPVLRLCGGETPVFGGSLDMSSSVAAEDIVADGENLRDGLTKSAARQYETEINATVRDALADFGGIDDVMTEVAWDGETINAVTVILSVSEDFANNAAELKKIRSKVEKLLSENYGINGENTVVSVSCAAD